MVVCKYFLQGTCKFGSNCHYDHDLSSNYNYSNYSTAKSTSILRQPNFANNPPSKPTTTSIDVNTLIKSVITDSNNLEKGGQWVLSSYTPFKEKPAFPGFEDQSFEEVRLGFYDASKNGTVDQYNQQLHMALQNTMSNIRALQNPNQEIVNMLTSIYNTPPSSCSGTFDQNTSSSSFPQMNVFASQNQTPASNPFQNNAFTSPTSTNIFAGGNPQTGNIFATTSPSNQNMFANNQGSIFTQQPQQNIFAQSQSAFSPPPNQNLFSPPTTNPPPYSSPQQNLFTQNQPQNLFPSQPQQNLFPQQPQQSIFVTQNQSSQNLFTTPSQQTSFGNSPMNSGSVFGGNNATIDESLYSKLEELGVDQIKWFDSDDLDILHIPDKPPTYEMCFKS